LKDKLGVLLFYPSDFTFVRRTELVEAANKHEKFKKSEIIFVGTDSCFVRALGGSIQSTSGAHAPGVFTLELGFRR